jgi:hypothetical protein
MFISNFNEGERAANIRGRWLEDLIRPEPFLKAKLRGKSRSGSVSNFDNVKVKPY